MQRRKVNDEIWLPSEVHFIGHARLFLVKGLHVDTLSQYSDYKKFKVETLSTIAKPKGAAEAPADAPAKPQ